MKVLQKTGLVIAYLGLILLLGSIFLGSYTLTENKVNEVIKDDDVKNNLFQAMEAERILDVEVKNQFIFVSRLKKSMENANQLIIEKFALDSNERSNLLEHATKNDQVSYDSILIDSIITGSSHAANYKMQKLLSNTSWMFGREYATKEQFENDLNQKLDDLEKQVQNEKGMNQYAFNTAVFQLTRLAKHGPVNSNPELFLILCFIVPCLGALMYFLPAIKLEQPGIKNDHIFFRSISNGGLPGIIFTVILVGYYLLIYWYPEYVISLVEMANPVSLIINGNPASRWFLYGLMYTLAILVFGVRMLVKYRGNRYQLIRTISVMFFQLVFAFLVPEILYRLNQPSMDLKNAWPLDYDFYFNGGLLNFSGMQNAGEEAVNGGLTGKIFLAWGMLLSLVVVPVLAYFFGKRWYCSWVCGCGGLAETLGDPYRQLSSKKLFAWNIERYLVHSVLVFVVIMTGLTIYTLFSGKWSLWGIQTGNIQKIYGFLIGSVFAGVIGTGFYPVMGNRVWCRFGCPLAAYLGIVQRFKSRFRITTNGGQCISCGNCSTYCEMGIDVRWYAQRGQNIVRASCVGCGICSAVCPRGVLKLEDLKPAGRTIPNGYIKT